VKRTWTIVGVGDVPASFKWYQSLLGLPRTAPVHDHFADGYYVTVSALSAA
jgi:hypothetical protein